MTNPDPILVQHYAVLKNISQKEAREKLKNNYEVEIKQIPLRDLVLRTLTGMRQVVPKVEGMNQEVIGHLSRIQKLEHNLEKISTQLKQNSQLIEVFEREIKYLKLPWYRKLMCRLRQK